MSSARGGRSGANVPVPVVSSSLASNLSLLGFAQDAIEELMAQGGFLDCTKAQFALRMGWVIPDHGIDRPLRRRVEEVCNLTRDQGQWPEIAEVLSGYVITYSPSQGGMLLVDPTGDQPLDHLTHLLIGDLQKQQSIKTMNRRRIPTWQAAADAAFVNGDQEMSRLFHQGEHEIKTIGFVSDSVIIDVFKAATVRGLLESAS